MLYKLAVIKFTNYWFPNFFCYEKGHRSPTVRPILNMGGCR